MLLPYFKQMTIRAARNGDISPILLITREIVVPRVERSLQGLLEALKESRKLRPSFYNTKFLTSHNNSLITILK